MMNDLLFLDINLLKSGTALGSSLSSNGFDLGSVSISKFLLILSTLLLF